MLGRLRPGPYAGGSVTLDLEAAKRAVATQVAEPLGISLTEAAAGIIRIVEQNLLHAVERISIQRGYNPGRFMLVACGGAGPMHGASVGRALGARAVYVPRQAGAFCAIGMQHADVRRDFVHVVMRQLDDGVGQALADGYAALEAQAADALRREGFEPGEVRFGHELDLHYEGQQWDIRVALAPDAAPEAIRTAFEAEYDRQYGHTNPGGRIVVSNLRVVGVGKLPPLAEIVFEVVERRAEPASTRPVYDEASAGFLDTAIHDGAALRPGDFVDGPAGDRGGDHHNRRRLRRARPGRQARQLFHHLCGEGLDGTRSRHPRADPEPARPHLAPDGLGDAAHRAQPDLQPGA